MMNSQSAIHYDTSKPKEIKSKVCERCGKIFFGKHLFKYCQPCKPIAMEELQREYLKNRKVKKRAKVR
jgi:hypothetical protein